MKLNLGSGPQIIAVAEGQEAFKNVDERKFERVDYICDLSKPKWIFTGEKPEEGTLVVKSKKNGGWYFNDNSVDEVFCSHFVEHLPGFDRIGFFNELYRVLKPGAKALIITPEWSHACAYGDPTHAFPPMSSWYALYLNKAWRDVNAPHVDYTCDFDWVHGASWDEWLTVKNDEMKQFAMQHYTNSIRDLHITLSKRA
jgi:hypothetical protein